MARGSIVKRGKTYSIVYYVGTKQKWEAIGPTKREAEKALADKLADLNKAPYRELKKVSFQDFAHKWLVDYAEGKVKPGTLDHYQRVVRVHLVPYFDTTPLQQISPEMVQGYISQKRTEGRLTPKTINNTLVPLKEMFKHAVRWGYLRENPALYVEKPRVERKEMDFLTPAEIRLLLEHARLRFRPLFLCAALTGMRRGELLALQWGDIDWHESQIYVRRSLYFEAHRTTQERKWRFITPKSKNSVRAINMSPTLSLELKKYKLAHPSGAYDLVFAQEDGKPLEPDNLVKREFIPALRRAGLRQVPFHSLRHSFTALLIAQGENIKYIQNQLGHASVQTTLDRYGHLLPATHKEAAHRLDQTLFGPSISKRL
ncbi:MAG TPA: tyrosine-type recombinase/integrase [Candidatus Binatia bacterium]|nr:tyrosine-type recombinase/integrase [Candidatus Binatia bacterium]